MGIAYGGKPIEVNAKVHDRGGEALIIANVKDYRLVVLVSDQIVEGLLFRVEPDGMLELLELNGLGLDP